MHLAYTGETVRMASLYSMLFACVCITLLLPSHVAKYYATTAYASCKNSKRTDFITLGVQSCIVEIRKKMFKSCILHPWWIYSPTEGVS